MKKVIYLIAISLLVSALLSASGSRESGGRVSLDVWYALGGTSGEAFLNSAEAFRKEHPELDIRLTYSGSYADTAAKIGAAVMAGNAPDLAVMAAGQIYTGGHGNFDMELLLSDPAMDSADFFPGMLDYGKYEGRIAALPYGISVQVVYYNRDITDALGLDLENNPPESWDDFLSLSLRIHEERGGYVFDTSDSAWLFKTMLAQHGNAVVEERDGRTVPVFASDSGVDAAAYWLTLVSEGVMPPERHTNAENSFLMGELPFLAASSIRGARWQGNTSFSLGAFPLPSGEDKSVALGGNVVTVFTRDERKREAAWEMVKFLLSAEEQTAFALSSGYLPIRPSSLSRSAVEEAALNNPALSVALEELEHSWAYWHFSEMGVMDSILSYAIDEIESGTLSPRDALTKAAGRLEKEIGQ